MEIEHRIGDDLGPAKVVLLREPRVGLVADPARSPADKERIVRVFARMIGDLADYIGGIPLDEIGATGFGLAVAAEVAAAAVKVSLADARVAIEGFGAVGQHAARFLAQRGVRLVAASDSRSAIESQAGLDVNALIAHKRSGQTVGSFPGGRRSERGDIVGVECDIWIPAARPDTLTADNIARLRARLVLQGANIPATPAAEEWMHAHGILSVPDFIANAGGVICAAVEYHGGTQIQAFASIEERIRSNTIETLERARASRILPREAATQMARVRVEEAMRYRGY